MRTIGRSLVFSSSVHFLASQVRLYEAETKEMYFTVESCEGGVKILAKGGLKTIFSTFLHRRARAVRLILCSRAVQAAVRY
jgi:hypothetical protein